jgi:LacI family transcriptional regulator/LacI family repressor for deo operon, udp, cdd, tsx, nupC, and nupG
MQNRRPTQKTIATMAGVHTSTVCLALKNHPTIPAATCERIQKIAAEIGYQPDPMLSALAAYRTTLRPAAFHGQLAWLSMSNARFDWRKVPVYAAYMQGAAKQAEHHGYTLEDFNLGERGMTLSRLAGIMQARGVRGILVCPMPAAHTVLDFPWANFSAVSLGHTLDRPALNLVAANHHQSLRLIFRQLTELGYERIGLALPGDLNARVGDHYLAAYLVDQRGVPASRRLAPYLEMPPSKAGFAAWLKKTRPDALITTNYIFPDYLKELGVKVPADLGVAVVFKRVAGDNFAGIDQNVRRTGEVAMDVLVSMIQRNETGVPSNPLQTQVEGHWVQGETVRAVASRAATKAGGAGRDR